MKSSATPAVRESDCLISKPFVKPMKVGIEQLVIIVPLSLIQTECSTRTFTLSQKAVKAPANTTSIR